MTEITKPQFLYKTWAETGVKVEPSDAKKELGYGAEIPTHEEFNWLEGRQDQAIAHFNQFGIPLWDSTTEYKQDKSYVQGSDGNIYAAVLDSTNINPTTDTDFSHWRPVLYRALKNRPLVNVTPQNSWLTSSTGGRFKVAVNNGYLMLDMQLNGGSTGNVAVGLLTSEYRPSVSQTAIAHYFDGTNWFPCRLIVENTGVVNLVGVGDNDLLVAQVSMVI